MPQITAKQRLNGFVLGVEFVNGQGETDSPTALSFFRQSEGYEVVEDKPKGKAAATTTDQ